MNKALSLALVFAAGTAVPALAEDTSAQQAAFFNAQLSVNANADQVRKLLIAKDYKNVSRLSRDENGRWTGTAFKNGKKTVVSVYLPPKPATAATN